MIAYQHPMRFQCMIGLIRWLAYETSVVAVWALYYDKLIAVGINVIAMILCQKIGYIG